MRLLTSPRGRACCGDEANLGVVLLLVGSSGEAIVGRESRDVRTSSIFCGSMYRLLLQFSRTFCRNVSQEKYKKIVNEPVLY
jgi:hypothetical protein